MSIAYLASSNGHIRVSGDFSEKVFNDLTSALSYVKDADVIVFAPGTYIVRRFVKDKESGLYVSRVFDKKVILIGIGSPLIKVKGRFGNRLFVFRRGGEIHNIRIDGGCYPQP